MGWSLENTLHVKRGVRRGEAMLAPHTAVCRRTRLKEQQSILLGATPRCSVYPPCAEEHPDHSLCINTMPVWLSSKAARCASTIGILGLYNQSRLAFYWKIPLFCSPKLITEFGWLFVLVLQGTKVNSHRNENEGVADTSEKKKWELLNFQACCAKRYLLYTIPSTGKHVYPDIIEKY